ncbi:MAG: hypothetical protein ACR2PT_03905 [Endozoicomonas sp.]
MNRIQYCCGTLLRATFLCATFLGAASLLAGCTGFPEREHLTPEAIAKSRKTVRDIFAQQRLNPDASQQHGGKAVEGEPGVWSLYDMRNHRGYGDSQTGEQSGGEITINVGTAQEGS